MRNLFNIFNLNQLKDLNLQTSYNFEDSKDVYFRLDFMAIIKVTCAIVYGGDESNFFYEFFF